MSLALLLSLSLASVSPPEIIRASSGPSLADILASGVRVLEQRDLELDGKAPRERIVLVSAAEPDGRRRAAGLVVTRRQTRGQLKVVAMVPLPYTADWDVSLAPKQPDISGDLRPEIAIDERLGGHGPRLHATAFWHLAAAGSDLAGQDLADQDSAVGLKRCHYITRRYAFEGRVEERKLTLGPPGELTERVTVTEKTGQAAPRRVMSQDVLYRWLPSGRFARVEFRVVQ